MNRINFLQTGGMPIDLNTFDAMQQSYTIFNALGEMAGNYSIIKGCEVIGNNVTQGVVYINGEVLPFTGGVVSDSVIIIEIAVASAEFESGEIKNTEFTRHATFGVGTTSYPWINFKRVYPTTQIYTLVDRLNAIETKLNTIETGAERNVNADWNATSGDGMILNKPVIPQSKILYIGQETIFNVPSEFITHDVSFTSSLSTYYYTVLGGFRDNQAGKEPSLIWSTDSYANNGFKLNIKELFGQTQYAIFDFVIISNI